MGRNQVKLVEGYLKLQEELEKTKDEHKSEIIKAKMEGIIFGYETYASERWLTFENLLKDYYYYMRRD